MAKADKTSRNADRRMIKARAAKAQPLRMQILALALAGMTAAAPGLPMLALSAPPAMAQNLFAPRVYVNDQVITEFEVQQRARFMQVLNAPGDPEAEALKSLIDDRLRMSEAKRLGVKLTPEELTAGMEEFAGRASMTADQLVGELQKAGISAETYRDFVQAGAVWRKIVRDRFSNRVPASEADVDKYLAASTRPKAMKVQVSELVIPAEPGNEDAAMAQAQRLSQDLRSEGAFAAAARNYSAAPTAPNGGRVPEWLQLSNLPGPIATQLLALSPGQTSAPIAVPGAVVLFQLRAIAMDEKAAPISVKVEWANLLFPDTPEELGRISAGTDSCNDLYALVKNLPPANMTVKEQPVSELPQDVAIALSKLDIGEFTTTSRGDGWRRLIMLCKREPIMDPPPNRDRVKEIVMNQKLDGLAENYLEEMRHAAIIRHP
ncbi:peptidylprolyl isomerase [Xinfangfangia sp. D13-10-4-6]|uniref:peptidylprolyl isomerase n=1 Tax=Pseudogemmobacter hezensis TaxID=2737662 RepID=UPI001551B885|nr:peptidylprolyl isomerase [Pseudogemmobacter hezensis]NPD15842.1 peptidylprolyl isomerase [Pseudogemmobacter hezensis]